MGRDVASVRYFFPLFREGDRNVQLYTTVNSRRIRNEVPCNASHITEE